MWIHQIPAGASVALRGSTHHRGISTSAFRRQQQQQQQIRADRSSAPPSSALQPPSSVDSISVCLQKSHLMAVSAEWHTVRQREAAFVELSGDGGALREEMKSTGM